MTLQTTISESDLDTLDSTVLALRTVDRLVYYAIHENALGKRDADGLSAILAPHFDFLDELREQLRLERRIAPEAAVQPAPGAKKPFWTRKGPSPDEISFAFHKAAAIEAKLREGETLEQIADETALQHSEVERIADALLRDKPELRNIAKAG